MHTFRHTERELPKHVLLRNGSFYYNRRVPERAVEAYGKLVRIKLSEHLDEAEQLSEKLTERLNAIWRTEDIGAPIDLRAILETARPRSCTLADLAEEYLSFRAIDPTPLEQAITALISVAGNRDIREYDRQDARAFVAFLKKKGSSTGTIRRRIGPLSALLNYGYSELEIEKRNPFARLPIAGEGEDISQRHPFTLDQLREGYAQAFASGSEIKLLMPILGETGCRIGEIVGLRIEDVNLDKYAIRITPHRARRLKTAGSERELPLVGPALVAIREIVGDNREGMLFPRYLKDGKIRATHASNALNKWLRNAFEGRTAHCLRHTFRDRLRAVECPLELIDELGGWSSVASVGSTYGKGYSLPQKRDWLMKIAEATE